MSTFDWMIWAWAMTAIIIGIGAAALIQEALTKRRERRRRLPPPQTRAVAGESWKAWQEGWK